MEIQRSQLSFVSCFGLLWPCVKPLSVGVMHGVNMQIFLN